MGNERQTLSVKNHFLFFYADINTSYQKYATIASAKLILLVIEGIDYSKEGIQTV